MSTFTNILQKKINNLEAQIRQLQEQNYNLRRKARWLMEAAASSDMSMLPQPEVQDMPQTPSGPSGVYGGNPDRYTAYLGDYAPGHPEIAPGVPWPHGYGHWRTSKNVTQQVQQDGSIYFYGAQGQLLGYYSPGPPPSFYSTSGGSRTYNPATNRWEQQN